MLSKALQNEVCIAYHANGYADILIVKIAVESARTSWGSDLLVLLCYHAPKDGNDLYFRPGPKANTRSARIWHMKKVKEQPGKEVCRNLLFLHATTGCDTTSRPNRVGKATVLKKFENVLSFKEQCPQLPFCCFRRCHCRWKSTCLIFWWWKTCKQDASYWVTKSKSYMAHVEFNRRIAFFWRLRTFLVVSLKHFSLLMFRQNQISLLAT